MLKYLNPEQLQNTPWTLSFSVEKTNSNVFDCCRTNAEPARRNHLHIIDVVWRVGARVRICLCVCDFSCSCSFVGSNNQHHGNDYCEAYQHSRMKQCALFCPWQNKLNRHLIIWQLDCAVCIALSQIRRIYSRSHLISIPSQICSMLISKSYFKSKYGHLNMDFLSKSLFHSNKLLEMETCWTKSCQDWLRILWV